MKGGCVVAVVGRGEEEDHTDVGAACFLEESCEASYGRWFGCGGEIAGGEGDDVETSWRDSGCCCWWYAVGGRRVMQGDAEISGGEVGFWFVCQ